MCLRQSREKLSSLALDAYQSCEIMPFHAKSCPFRQNHAIAGHGIAWIFPPTLVEFVGQ